MASNIKMGSIINTERGTTALILNIHSTNGISVAASKTATKMRRKSAMLA